MLPFVLYADSYYQCRAILIRMGNSMKHDVIRLARSGFHCLLRYRLGLTCIAYHRELPATATAKPYCHPSLLTRVATANAVIAGCDVTAPVLLVSSGVRSVIPHDACHHSIEIVAVCVTGIQDIAF